MIDKQTKNIIIDNIFKTLSDCDWHVIKYKDIYDNYDFRNDNETLRLMTKKLVDDYYITNQGSSMTCLKLDTLGLDVIDAGGWIEYLKQTEPTEIEYKHETHNHYEKVGAVYNGDVTAETVTAELKESSNYVGGDNLGTQSSERNFKKSKKIEKNIPIEKENKIKAAFSFIVKHSVKFIIGLVFIIITYLLNNGYIDISFITDKF